MTKKEIYEHVFGSEEGRWVLSDIARHVETMEYEKPGSAVLVIGYLQRMTNQTNITVGSGGTPPLPKASGGRIAHG